MAKKIARKKQKVSPATKEEILTTLREIRFHTNKAAIFLDNHAEHCRAYAKVLVSLIWRLERSVYRG